MIENKMTDGAGSPEDHLRPLLSRMSEQASAIAHQGADAVRDSSHQLRKQAEQARDETLKYIRNEPIKATLIAAATGAALMALVTMVGRFGRRD